MEEKIKVKKRRLNSKRNRMKKFVEDFSRFLNFISIQTQEFIEETVRINMKCNYSSIVF